jgi:hypothetical protein
MNWLDVANPFSRVLCHKYHRAGAVIARLSVNTATLIWSIVVLISDDALAPTPYGRTLLLLMPEDAWGWSFLCLSSVMICRLLAQSKPHPLGIIGYMILLLAWGYVEIVMLMMQRPLFPTAVATVSVITALAVYGFVANPRPRCAEPG